MYTLFKPGDIVTPAKLYKGQHNTIIDTGFVLGEILNTETGSEQVVVVCVLLAHAHGSRSMFKQDEKCYWFAGRLQKVA